MTSVLHLLTSPAAAAVKVLPLLADAAIKGVVIFGVAACAVALCRRRSAATRHAIWAGAVVAQLALPSLALMLPAWRVPLADRIASRLARVADEIAIPSDNDLVVTAAFPAVEALPAIPPIPDVPPVPAIPDVPVPTVEFPTVTVMPDVAPAVAAAATARAEARLARAQARLAREQARMARAQARAARAQALGIGVAGGFGAGGGIGAGASEGVTIVRPAAHRSWTITTLMSGRGASWWLRFAGIVWLIGAIGIFARFVAGTLAVSRLTRRSERVDDGRWLSLTQRIAIRLGVARPMTLLRSGRFDVPVTWGVIYPVVLLPDDADDWSDERRRYVLVHEMAHVKRVDAFTQLLAQLAIAVFWFDPFVWIAAHRMRVEREHACDDYVLREGTPASTYAADLLAMVRSLGSRGRAAQPAFAALAMARPDELETRMQAILDPAQDRRSLSSRSTLGIALCSLLLLLPLAAFRPLSARHTTMPLAAAGPMHAGTWRPADIVMSVPANSFEMPSDSDMAPLLASLDSLRGNLTEAVASTHGALASAISADVGNAIASTAVTTASAGTPAPSAPAQPAVRSWSSNPAESCSSVSLKRSGSSTSIHSSSDDDDSSFQYISSSAGRCLQVAVWGHVEFAPDERAVTRISRDGRLYVRERRSDVDRELTVTNGDEDAPRYAYSVDGERAEFDEGGRAWLEALLPEVLRESGLNARQRVARIRRDGGVGAVLADIARTQSTSAKRAAYEALLKQGNLSNDDEARIARQAGSDLASSDGELRAILGEIGKDGHFAPAMAEAFGKAVEHMSSDGEKRELLQQYALQGDRDMLIVTMRHASSISSDGEKAEFLRSTASRYLTNDDETLRKAFFGVTQSISSDGEKREVLMQVLPYAQRPSVLTAVLETAQGISSDGEKSELLVSILRRKCVTTPALKELFMKTTRSLSSDAEYRRVMEAMLQT